VRQQAEQLAEIYAAAATPEEALTQHLEMLAQVQIDGTTASGFVPGTFNMSMPTSLLREDARITGKLQELMNSNAAVFGERPSADRRQAELAHVGGGHSPTAQLCDVRRRACIAYEQQPEAFGLFKLILDDAMAAPVFAQPRVQRERGNTRPTARGRGHGTDCGSTGIGAVFGGHDTRTAQTC